MKAILTNKVFFCKNRGVNVKLCIFFQWGTILPSPKQFVINLAWFFVTLLGLAGAASKIMIYGVNLLR